MKISSGVSMREIVSFILSKINTVVDRLLQKRHGEQNYLPQMCFFCQYDNFVQFVFVHGGKKKPRACTKSCQIRCHFFFPEQHTPKAKAKKTIMVFGLKWGETKKMYLYFRRRLRLQAGFCKKNSVFLIRKK